ncbi:MAG: hypothetical protein ACD_2C00200G0003 [uncultured bacterium (gcode 4)]|uniref:DNA replication and repair protein RecF n=1 Tax=uncultured bacterium (gcode 4) TaxID=1234023 RepID=K2G4J1_9BACT|nr:MAG: hypothetical protein ACD_2C00200G0003 [uncultured bacterium (gcode 4)]
MLRSLELHDFKIHTDSEFSFSDMNLIVWANGSGKTNILEAIYLLLNSRTYQSQNIDRLVNFLGESFLVSGKIGEDYLSKTPKVTYDSKTQKSSFLLNWIKSTRPKYLENTKHIAVFFSPLEMNIIYLGPSLRRDFLDEVCTLSNVAFSKVRSDYSKILRSRNKLLKWIQEWKAEKEDLKFWNSAFVKVTSEYYTHRKKFLDFVSDNISIIENFLENKYKLSFNYKTKVDFADLEKSISAYIEKNIDRDIMTGCTYIWPHLDDFQFIVETTRHIMSSEECLSRGENKSILIWLKFLEIEFYKKLHSENIIILLDDIFSELDDEHIGSVMDYCDRFQTFITAQNMPQFLLDKANINVIYT